MENQNLESKPIRKTAQADERDGESQADKAAPHPVVKPTHSEAEEPNPAERKEETDRKQDEAIDSLAEQTEWIAKQTQWMAKQTKWVRNQFWAASILGALTLAVLIYQGLTMRGQLENMQSSSKQTQDLIEATRGTANASQSVAEQNRELVKHAGEQADAAADQAKASLAQAEAAKQSVSAAQSFARAAEKGAQVAQESFYIGDRPYVTAKNAMLDKFEAGVKPRINVLFINTGKTPALDLQMGAVVSVGRLPKPDLNTVQNPSDLVYPFMAEGSAMLLPASGEAYGAAQGTEVLSKTIVEEIKNGKMYLFVWGGALYKDGLGRRHGLQFCLFYNPYDEGFVACPAFNKIK